MTTNENQNNISQESLDKLIQAKVSEATEQFTNNKEWIEFKALQSISNISLENPMRMSRKRAQKFCLQIQKLLPEELIKQANKEKKEEEKVDFRKFAEFHEEFIEAVAPYIKIGGAVVNLDNEDDPIYEFLPANSSILYAVVIAILGLFLDKKKAI
jgi:hypothetical protein